MLGDQKVEIRTGTGFPPIPADKYTVMIGDVNLVDYFNPHQGKEEKRLKYQFGILNDDKTYENDKGEEVSVRGRFLWRMCSLTLHPKATLTELVTAVYGRKLTVDEKENFQPEDIVGKQVDVMVNKVESEKEPGRFFNNILSFSKVTKELKPLVASPGAVEEKSSQAVEEEDDFIKGLEEDRAKESLTDEDLDKADKETEKK